MPALVQKIVLAEDVNWPWGKQSDTKSQSVAPMQVCGDVFRVSFESDMFPSETRIIQLLNFLWRILNLHS